MSHQTENERLKILVVTSGPVNQASACQTLSGHDVTVVGSADEALMILRGDARRTWGLDEFRNHCDEKIGESMPVRQRKAECCKYSRPYDAILSELFIASKKNGVESLPLGMNIVLLASRYAAKYSATLTKEASLGDEGWHLQPEHLMVQDLGNTYCWQEKDFWVPLGGGGSRSEANFLINGTTVGFFAAPAHTQTDIPCEDCEGSGEVETSHYSIRFGHSSDVKSCKACRGSGVKLGLDWGKVLSRLVESRLWVSGVAPVTET